MNLRYSKIFLLVPIFFAFIYSCNNAAKPKKEPLMANMKTDKDSVYLKSYFLDRDDRHTGELDTCECRFNNDTLLITIMQLGGFGGESGLVIKKKPKPY